MPGSEFDSLLKIYRAIELRVEVLMSSICAPHCRVCLTPCCRIAICREAVESPFLLAVHGAKQAFDPTSGYLGATGCTLGAGRPPVCHAFLCAPILHQQSSDQRRFALQCLGDLTGYLGKRVWLNRHLVEAITDSDLLKANHSSFQQRLATGANVMDVLESYFAHDLALNEREIAQLSVIRKPT